VEAPGEAIPELAEAGELTNTEIDKVMAFQGEGEPEELEELDELDGLEELEEPEPDLAAGKAPSAESPPVMSNLELANLASQIEFSTSPVETEEEDTALEKDLEIVSPFATMLSDFSGNGAEDTKAEEEPPPRKGSKKSSKTKPSDGTEEGEKKKPVEKEAATTAKRSGLDLETLAVQPGMSLVYKPFLYTGFSDPQPLESVPNDFEENPSEAKTPEENYDTPVIEEREGIHYINREILNPGPQAEKDLDPDFKELVDSVIKEG
jgi:hypothetical protein